MMSLKPMVLWKLFPFLFLTVLVAVPGRANAQEQGIENLRQTGQAFRAVAKKVSPAVVFIKVEKTADEQDMSQFPQFFSPFDNPFGDQFFHRFFGTPPQGQGPGTMPKHHIVGQGSGFLISPDGLIMTNNHVVGDADKVTVRLLDGREFTAKVIGTDPPTDVALIRIDAKDLPYLELGDSEKIQVGDWVLAVGNPFGLSHTITAGIVSAKGRSGIGLSDYENFIQTDAAINPGNSGGPLVDLDGNVVGMNTAIYSNSGGYMGIGFAIPINMAKEIRDQLLEHGKVTRGHLGIYIQQMTKDLAESFGLKESEGILVSKVVDGSPAAKAGLKQGDVLLKVDGRKVGKVAEFRNAIAMTAPGTAIHLDLLRDGKPRQVEVTIGKQETESKENPAASGSEGHLGLTLQPLTSDLAAQLGYKGEKGALVGGVEDGSPAAEAGIQRGDLIQEVNRKPVTSPEEVGQAIKNSGKKPVLLLVRHGEAARYVAIRPE
jgi:serine protease Do